MEFIVELILEILFGIPEIICDGEDIIKESKESKSIIKKVLCVLFFIAGFVGSFFVPELLISLCILPL